MKQLNTVRKKNPLKKYLKKTFFRPKVKKTIYTILTATDLMNDQNIYIFLTGNRDFLLKHFVSGPLQTLSVTR